MKKGLKNIALNEDGSVKQFDLLNGESIQGDLYVSAMPVDIMKKLMPDAWYQKPFFSKLDNIDYHGAETSCVAKGDSSCVMEFGTEPVF